MPKIGQGRFGARQLRERRQTQAGRRQLHGRCRVSESPALNIESVARRSPTGWDYDEEAPPFSPRLLQHEAKHFAPDTGRGEEFQHLVSAPEDSILTMESSANLTVEALADRINAQKDAHWEEQKKAAGVDFDEEEVMIEYAKRQLLQTNSCSEMMLTAELLIEEDWLGKVDALPGNIYRLAVMGDIFVSSSRSTSSSANAQAMAKILGVITIVTIQFIGPPLIFLSRTAGIGVLADTGFMWECCPWHWNFDSTSDAVCAYKGTAAKDVTYFDDWYHVATSKALAMLLMMVFCLNGLFVILDERHSWKQIYNTFRFLDIKNKKFKLTGRQFLYMDSLVNSWVIAWCCVDVFLLLGAAASPSDILMNALGLLFLYNLDDVGGDLGFINDDDWPGHRLSWIYQELVVKCPTEIFDEESLDTPGSLTIGVYNILIACLSLLSFGIPLLTAFTPFIQVVPAG